MKTRSKGGNCCKMGIAIHRIEPYFRGMEIIVRKEAFK